MAADAGEPCAGDAQVSDLRDRRIQTRFRAAMVPAASHDLLTSTTRGHGHGHSIASASRASRGVEAREHDGSRVIRVGLSWGRILEPRELGLRGFRTMPPPSTGDPSRAQPVDRPRPDRTRPLASDTGPRQPRRPDERIG